MKSPRKARKSLLWSTLKIMEWTRTVMTLLMMSPHQRNPFRPGQRVIFLLNRSLTKNCSENATENLNSFKSEFFFCLFHIQVFSFSRLSWSNTTTLSTFMHTLGMLRCPNWNGYSTKANRAFSKEPALLYGTHHLEWAVCPIEETLLGGKIFSVFFFFYFTVFFTWSRYDKIFYNKVYSSRWELCVWENAWDSVVWLWLVNYLYTIFLSSTCPIFLLFPLCIATQDALISFYTASVYLYISLCCKCVVWSLITGCTFDLKVAYIFWFSCEDE